MNLKANIFLCILYLKFILKRFTMNKKLEEKVSDNTEFQSIIKDLIENKTVQEMNNYRQHFNTSCFEHCYIASYYCYKICKLFKLDYKSAARRSNAS